MWWSLGFSILSVAAVVTMDCPAFSTLRSQFGDDSLMDRAILPLIVSGVSISVSFLFAIPVFVSGNFRPARWLFPTSIALTGFVICYDWRGLIVTGRPTHHHLWRDLQWLAFAMRYGHLGEIVLFICVPWFCWKFCRNSNSSESLRRRSQTVKWVSGTETHRKTTCQRDH